MAERKKQAQGQRAGKRAPQRPKRQYSDEQKASVLATLDANGGNVSVLVGNR
jgi:hypothetical protein